MKLTQLTWPALLLAMTIVLHGGSLDAQSDDAASAKAASAENASDGTESPSDGEPAAGEEPASESQGEAAPAEDPPPSSDTPTTTATATAAGSAEPTGTSSPPPVTAATASVEPTSSRRQDAIASLTIFVLAVYLGYLVISKVPPTLHTPLMSGSNAISGITLVGAVLVASSWSFSGAIGFVAVMLATINVVGGFLVTHRMLAMFKKR